MNNFKKILLAISLLAFTSAASAITLGSSISFSQAGGASWSLTTDGPGGADDVLHFHAGIAPGPVVADAIVVGTTGDYTPIPFFTPTNFHDFVYSPFAASTLLWDLTYSGVTYKLYMDSQAITQSGNEFIIAGLGTMFIGTDTGKGTYSITLNQDGSSLSWSSSAAVPEPAIALLLATGLIAFGFTRRKAA